MAAVGSYLAIQRDDSGEVQAELKDHTRRLTVLETKQNIMWDERAEPDRQGARGNDRRD